MKSLSVLLAILLICSSLPFCSSVSRTSRTNFFGEGGSSQDTLFVRALDRPVAFVMQKNFRGEGGSSQDTLFLKPGEQARFFRVKDDRDKK